MRFKCNRESANGSLHSPNLNPPGPLKKDGREHLNQQIAIFYPFFSKTVNLSVIMGPTLNNIHHKVLHYLYMGKNFKDSRRKKLSTQL